MKTVDFYSGEPSVDGSPPLTENEAMLAAAEQASQLRAYSYDPVARQALRFNTGYYTQPPQYPYQQPFQQQPCGIGYPPMYPTGGYYPYNPYWQHQQVQPQQPTPRTITIPGVNRGGEFMFTQEHLDRLEEMKKEYIRRKREIEVECESSNGGYGTNYYGVPYYSGTYFKMRELDQEFMQEIEKIKEEARENRKAFNMSLGRLSYNVLGERISDEALHERYYGKTISYEAPVVQNLTEAYSDAYRFNNVVEIDTAAPYQQRFAQIREMHAQYYVDDGNPKNAFKNYGLLSAKYQEEEAIHEMRNLGRDYNSDTYNRLMKQKIRERNQQKTGGIVNVPPPGPFGGYPGYPTNPNLTPFPTLAQNARLADDGTLHITCNFGSHNGEILSVHNSQEQEYEKDRERFNRFLASIPDANTYRGGG